MNLKPNTREGIPAALDITLTAGEIEALEAPYRPKVVVF